ncbi:MAG: serine hydrolase [Eubacteriales bacterium]|nr:serine hydrolase [Eubacteriales bacterium]MDD3882752.1 serine hydrolase [Eubacteriales bacterium]MDD4512627.1 serine hydrolase [Eubacteriales bacterium]
MYEDFRGCIRLVKNGKTLFSQESGYADLPNEIPNSFERRYPTASAGKAFVAAGILKLIEEGKLSFDDNLKSLADFDIGRIDGDTTVRELLTHTSGVPDYFDESVMSDYDELWRDYPNYKIRTSRDLLPLFINKPMLYKRGERFMYNNSGYVLLGLIIESVMKKPFDEYLREAVFEKCGMLSTGYFELDRLPARCANAYIADEKRGGYYTNIFSVDVKGTGAGGAYTTVHDVELFWQGLVGGKIIGKALMDEMTSVQAQSGNEKYGLGLWLHDIGSEIQLSFEGCDPGVSFFTAFRRKSGIMLTAVSNFADDVWKVGWDLISKAENGELI